MKRVKEICIKNFKAFQQEEKLILNGKHVLIHGNNGAGKSSFFWALYTLLQSSIKQDINVQKYFENFDVLNPRTHQSLKNVFTGTDEDSFIKLNIIDTETERESIFTISNAIINTNNSDDPLIQESNYPSVHFFGELQRGKSRDI